MEKKHNIDNDKRIVLPFAKYEVSYNPSDALTLSILKGNKNKFEIFNCCWEVFAFQFCQNGYQYFDAHLWHNTQSIKREFVKRVLLEEDISLNFENALKEGKYIFVVLDRTKIHGFNDKKFFPHLVSIYGVDLSKKVFMVADFGENVGYQLYTISYGELESANKSINEHIKYLDKKEKAFSWITNIEFVTYKKNIDNKMAWERQMNEIDAVLGGIQFDPIDNIENQNIARFQEDGFLLVPISNVTLGIKVFDEMVAHLKKALQDKKYIVEIKHFYLMYEYAFLLKQRLNLINQSGIRESQYDAINVEKIVSKYKICISLGIKYKLTNNNIILERAISELEINNALLIQEIKKYQTLIKKIWNKRRDITNRSLV